MILDDLVAATQRRLTTEQAAVPLAEMVKRADNVPTKIRNRSTTASPLLAFT